MSNRVEYILSRMETVGFLYLVTEYKDEDIVWFLWRHRNCIKYQLMYFLKETHAKTLAEVTNTKNADGLSGID